MKPAVTLLVVTPTLGRSVHLARTVASVAGLGLPARHILVAPGDQIDRIQGGFPGTLVVPDAGPRSGVYGALNAALDRFPDGWSWFTYVNDDDALLPGFAAAAARHLARPDAEPVVYGDVEMIDSSGRSLGKITVERNPDWIPALLQEGISPLMQQGMLFRHDCVTRLQRFDLRYRLCADLDFWLRALVAGERFRYHPLTVAQFRIRPGQLSGDTSRTVAEQEDIVSRHLPVRLPAWRRPLARIRYRLANLPRYCVRIRRAGLRTSYGILHDPTCPIFHQKPSS